MTDRTAIPQEVNDWYDKTLLYRAVPLFVHTRWAQVRNMPRNAGTNVIKFRRYSNLAAALVPLSDGITPAGTQLSTTEIIATVEQYGNFTIITDRVQYETPDMILTEAAQILGTQAAMTLDIITRDVITAGTNVLFGGNATSTATVDAADLIDDVVIKEAVRLLKNNLTLKITNMIDATTGISTIPINSAFVGIVHPNTTFDLKAVTGWIPVEKYASQKTVMDGEVGAVDEVRFVESTNAQVFVGAGAAGIDVYATMIIGENFYGTTMINGETLKNIVKPLGSAGTGDPLDQRTTSGWKTTFTAKILNDAFGVRIEHAVSV